METQRSQTRTAISRTLLRMLKLEQKMLAGLALVALVLFVGGCSGNSTTAETEAEPVEETVGEAVEEVTETAEVDPATAYADLPRLEGTATVVMTVNGGPITIALDGTKAPITAGNFVDLAQKGVYDNTLFHRVIREPDPFVVQGGDPQSQDPSVPTQLLGTGNYTDPDTGEARYIPLEILPSGEDEPLYGETFSAAGVTKPPALTHKRGAVAMARSQFPNSASAQFYITIGDVNFLDGEYAVFGEVTEGMDIVDGIQQGDVIESVTVVDGADNLKL